MEYTKKSLWIKFAPMFNFELDQDQVLAKALKVGFIKEIGEDKYEKCILNMDKYEIDIGEKMNPCLTCGKGIPMTHATRIISGVDGVPIGVQHLYKCQHQQTVIDIQRKTTLVQKIKALLGVK